MFIRVPLAFIVLCFIAGLPTVEGEKCELKSDVVLVCRGIIDDHPNSLDANLHAAFPLSSPPESLRKVTKIVVENSPGRNVTINENTLLCFPNLTKLIIGGDPKALDRMVNIHPRAFRRTPALTWLLIYWISVTDGTVEAIASLKDQLGTLHVMKVRSMDKIVPNLAQFTRLRDLYLDGEGNCGELVPSNIIAKSASILTHLVIVRCTPPDSKVTASMFANMPNLVKLEWLYSDITEIESGSFDANRNLQRLDFYENRIRILPDGLFSKLTKLKTVDFRFNGDSSSSLVDNLSRSNFTHVDNFEQFWLSTWIPGTGDW